MDININNIINYDKKSLLHISSEFGFYEISYFLLVFIKLFSSIKSISLITLKLETFNSGNGGSIVFDGTNDYVLGSNSYSINSSQPFTMEFWVNLSNYSPVYQSLFQIKTNTTYGFVIAATQASGYDGISFGSTNDWVRLRNNGNQLSTNTWYNIVVTYNGSGSGTSNNYKMYINTIEETLVNSSIYVGLSQINNIGTIENGSRGIDNLNGKMSIVRLYNKSFSTQEVLQNYNAIKGRFGL
jgi:hypothetical protein